MTTNCASLDNYVSIMTSFWPCSNELFSMVKRNGMYRWQFLYMGHNAGGRDMSGSVD